MAVVMLAATLRSAAGQEEGSAWLASKGFLYREAKNSALVHMSRDDLRRQSARDLNAFLRRVPGVRVRGLPNGGHEVLLDPSPLPGDAACHVETYLNGGRVELRQFDLTPGSVDPRSPRRVRLDDLVPFQNIDGLELYGPRDSPVASDESCGVLLIWSYADRRAADVPFTGAVKGIALRNADGVPIQGARITLRTLGHNAVTDARGRFAFAAVPAGNYDIIAEVTGAPAWHGFIEVRAFGAVNLELRLER
jgi:hypothetical protein